MKAKLFAGLAVCTILLSSTLSRKAPKKVGPFVYIPTGEVIIGEDKERDTISGFYIFNSEVTNLDYREFLYTKEIKEHPNYKLFEVDSVGWRQDFAFQKPYVQHYHRHPAYNNYPVVNISKEGARAYCKWLEGHMNHQYAAKFNAKLEVRLPTKKEWIRAGRGDKLNAVFPWGGPNLQNARGQYLCNFKKLNSSNICYDYKQEQYFIGGHPSFDASDAFMTSPTGSYPTNYLMVSDMSGNVAEMVQEEGIAMGGSWNSPGGNVRLESEMPFTGRSREVGFRPVLIVHPNSN